MNCADVGDLRLLARRRLPRFLFEYVDGGAFAEQTMRRNVDDLQGIAVRQRILKDVSDINLGTELLGDAAAMPVALAPVGLAGLYARRGEVQAARAAEAAGAPFCMSTVAGCSMEEVRGAVQRPFWFQLYMIRDRGFMHALLDRAEAAGITNLFLTVDLPVSSTRYRDIRTGLAGGRGALASIGRMLEVMRHPAWAFDVGVMGRPHALGNVAGVMPPGTGLFGFFEWVARNYDPSVTWNDIAWLRERWRGRLVLKGVLEPEDAQAAVAAGADGIVVSNHGGRQLDGAPSTISALPAVADAVAGRATVLMDSGIRSGLDVLRALALGADGVMVGRAWAYALAAQGGPGVTRMLEILRQEMKVAMALLGETDVRKLGREILVNRGTLP
ncbi:L-lactate dehydrogenase [Phenylobacterium deserti]|uniref:L-lactate dehydrogenase n=1 Tax=Phenylobacterium deserti TaxID=1914756 RepID=A0A328A8W8_9CAUL|nr:L-lactate dehydrogenase [Phenylobacterium deserti]RAK50767.1 L-lactate dehydrogenase [Phenylobacterium deserti]